jgi:hypothetical protein
LHRIAGTDVDVGRRLNLEHVVQKVVEDEILTLLRERFAAPRLLDRPRSPRIASIRGRW